MSYRCNPYCAIFMLSIQDPNVMKKSGRVATTADLSTEYGFTAIDGKSILYYIKHILFYLD